MYFQMLSSSRDSEKYIQSVINWVALILVLLFL